jgi:nucleotide-binding universal stress UspA family protein
MYKKILVPLDGSPIAECVIPHIEAIAKACGSDVELISVIEPIEIPTRGRIALTDEDMNRITSDIKKEIHKYLDSISDRLNRSGIKTNPVILTGKPADSLVEYANNNHIDMLIMTTHGRSGISKWLWGSVAEKVIHAVNVPVLLIKANECPADA